MMRGATHPMTQSPKAESAGVGEPLEDRDLGPAEVTSPGEIAKTTPAPQSRRRRTFSRTSAERPTRPPQASVPCSPTGTDFNVRGEILRMMHRSARASLPPQISENVVGLFGDA